jgi:outer membrane protein assembly factor BamB
MTHRTLLLIPLTLCLLRPALAEDWPQWRGPDRTGISKEMGLLKSWPPAGPKLLWTFRDMGVGYSSMAVVGNRLYSMGGNEDDKKEYVYALDLKTQKKLWSVEVGEFFGHAKSNWPGPRGTPTVDGNFLYVVGGYGDLVCVEINSGRKIWSQAMRTGLGGQMGWYGYGESPLVDGDLVIATPGGKKGAIAAFDKKTGTLKWRSKDCTYSTAYASMIAVESGGVRQYVQAPNSETAVCELLVGVRASDGKLLWELPCPRTVASGGPHFSLPNFSQQIDFVKGWP